MPLPISGRRTCDWYFPSLPGCRHSASWHNLAALAGLVAWWLLSSRGDAIPWNLKYIVADPGELPDLARFVREIRRCQVARFAKQLNEDADLGPQDVRVDGFAQIVNGAHAVSPLNVLIIQQVRGQKQDRHVLGAPALFDHLGQLQPADPRHPDV